MKLWILPVILVLILMLSISTLSSIAPDSALRQLFFTLVSAVVFAVASSIRFEWYIRQRWVLYVVTLGLLMLPFLLGHSARNTSRWIELGFFNLQSSQLVLPLIGIPAIFHLCAGALSLRRTLEFGALIAGPLLIVFLSPDLGTTLVIAAAFASCVWLAGIPHKWVGIGGVIGLMLAVVVWQFALQNYQRERMQSFIVGTQGGETHYNAQQALIAIGSGQLWGRGLGKGIQSHLSFLPEKHTDFIFAAFAEEHGLAGSLLLLSLYSTLLWYLFRLAKRTPSPEAALYCLMCAVTFALHIIVNIGMNVGLLPITGITLPFMSYGGSSLLAFSGFLGIVQSIARTSVPQARLHLT